MSLRSSGLLFIIVCPTESGNWELSEGTGLEAAIERQFADPRASYLHVHFAAPGCYAARIERA